MALANIACILAERQKKIEERGGKVKGVLMIDWDLEAPSLHRYFRNHFTEEFSSADNNHDFISADNPGLLEFFYELKKMFGQTSHEEEQIFEEAGNLPTAILDRINLSDFVVSTDIPHLYLLKAGQFNSTYSTRVRHFNWENLFDRSEDIFRLWSERLADEYDYVLIDSRTGVTDVSNICTMLMPEKLVAVFTPNRQNVEGLTEQLRTAMGYRSESDDIRKLVVFPLPARIETSEQDLRKVWRFGNEERDIPGYQPTFEGFFSEAYPQQYTSTNRCNLTAYFNEVQIQYSTAYAYGEEISALLEPDESRLSLSRSYKKFTEILLKRGPWNEQALPSNQSKSTSISEIEVLCDKSEDFSQKNDSLKALMSSLKAAILLEQAPDVPDNIRNRVVNRLGDVSSSISEKNRFEQHEYDVSGVDFNPKEGGLIASVSKDRTLKIWKTDGRLADNCDAEHQGEIRDVAFSSEGNLIASACEDRLVRLWDTNGDLLNTFESHTDQVLSVCFSPDSKVLVSASADRSILLWYLNDEAEGQYRKRKLGEHDSRIYGVSFHPDGHQIASVGEDGQIKIWLLLPDGEFTSTTIANSDSKLFCVSFSPNGQMLAAAGDDRLVRIWDSNRELIHTFRGHGGAVQCVSFNQDSTQIATASDDETIRLWSTVTGAELQTFRGHSGKVNSVKFCMGDTSLVSGGSDKTIRLWKIDELLAQRYKSAVFSPCGKKVASVGSDLRVNLWDFQGNLLTSFYGREGHKSTIHDVAFQPNLQEDSEERDELIASASEDGTIRIWSSSSRFPKVITNGVCLRTVCFSADGQLVAYGGDDPGISIRDLNKDSTIQIQGHSKRVLDVSFSPDNTKIASASADTTIKLWDLKGNCLKTLDDSHDSCWVYSVSFSPDSKKLVSASFNDVKIWDLETGKMQVFREHADWVYSVCFANHETFLSASHDGTIKLWTLGGVAIKTFTRHTNAVRSVSVSSDKEHFVSTSDDGTIKLWCINGDTTDPIISIPRPSKQPSLAELRLNSCHWLSDYLQNNQTINSYERSLCSDIS